MTGEAEWAAYDELPDPVFVVEASSGTLVFTNRAALGLLDYTTEQLRGGSLDLIHGGASEGPSRVSAWREGAEGGPLRFRFQTRAGTEISVEVLVRACARGDDRLLIGSARPLESPETVERERQKAQQTLRVVGELARVGPWELDLETMTPSFSEEVGRIYGLPPGVVPPVEEGLSYYAPQGRPSLTKAVDDAIAEGRPYDIESPFISAQGERLWVRTIGRTERREGKVVRLYGAFQDVTEAKRTALRREAVDDIRLATLRLGFQDGIETVLPALSRSLSSLRVPTHRCFVGPVQPRDAIDGPEQWWRLDGGRWTCVAPSEAAHLTSIADAGASSQPYWPARAAADPGVLEGLDPLGPGEVGSALITPGRNCGLILGSEREDDFSIADRDVARELTDHLGWACDRVDELYGIELRDARVRQAEKMEAIGRLAGGVAHDFNNLLMVIRGTCDMLQDDLTNVEQISDAADAISREIEAIDQASHRAQALTQQLLAFSRQQVLEPRAVGLNAAVEKLEPVLSHIMGRDIEVDLVLEAEPDTILVDPNGLEQILLNLTNNAKDAMPQGGRLRISTRRGPLDDGQTDRDPAPPTFVILEVADSGVGMDDVTLRRVFEPFFTTKVSGKGTGLGLAMVLGTVSQEGGHVRASSRPGEGSRFHLYLPEASA